MGWTRMHGKGARAPVSPSVTDFRFLPISSIGQFSRFCHIIQKIRVSKSLSICRTYRDLCLCKGLKFDSSRDFSYISSTRSSNGRVLIVARHLQGLLRKARLWYLEEISKTRCFKYLKALAKRATCHTFWHSLATHLCRKAVRLFGSAGVRGSQGRQKHHVLNKGRCGVRSPFQPGCRPVYTVCNQC